MPVACGPPLPSAAQSGPATSAVLFRSPLQQTRCPASASWAQRTPPLPTLLPPLLQLTTWDRPTTPGGYGAPQSEEEALTLGLIRTSLMKIKINQKTKVGAPHLDHDMPVSKTSSKALHCYRFPVPPLFAGQARSLAPFRSFLQLWYSEICCCACRQKSGLSHKLQPVHLKSWLAQFPTCLFPAFFICKNTNLALQLRE